MNYTVDGNNIILELNQSRGFDVSQTLSCGQCFRFMQLAEDTHAVIAFGKILKIQQTPYNVIFIDCTEDDFKNIWLDYFDLSYDYCHLVEVLSDMDHVLREACDYAPSIHILHQDVFECMISFIISQNKSIPMIKQVIKSICQRFGQPIEILGGDEIYSFPTPTDLSHACESDFLECKAGFRAKYLVDAISKLHLHQLDIQQLKSMETTDAKTALMSVKGIGNKVSDCILLYSLGRMEVFPTDVWVKRVMEHFYFNGKNTPINEIQQLADEKFGNLAGYAQQYLFHYARQMKIGRE